MTGENVDVQRNADIAGLDRCGTHAHFLNDSGEVGFRSWACASLGNAPWPNYMPVSEYGRDNCAADAII